MPARNLVGYKNLAFRESPGLGESLGRHHHVAGICQEALTCRQRRE